MSKKTIQSQVPKLGFSSVKSVVAAMSIEEKVSLVVGTGMEWPDISDEKHEVSRNPHSPQELIPGAAGTSYPLPEFNISPMVFADGPAGLRIAPHRNGDSKTYYCTAFPVATLLASTWDTELVKQVGAAMGNEVLEYGADVLLAPAINIHRNPLCGRNFEYYSEDPMVAGVMAAAMVNGVQSQGVGTSLKHFAANNSENYRNTLDTKVSQRALREIYLEGFRIAVEKAQPWTVMSSYNLINGTYTSESYDLITKILRNEWGFKGFVMTDWHGGISPEAQMKAGNDMIMPGRPKQINEIIQAVNTGSLDVKTIDENVERILSLVLLSPHFKRYKFSNNPDLKVHAAIARIAAAEGMILLKNEKQALPILNTCCKVALFGIASYNTVSGGTGSGDVNKAYMVSISDGLSNAGFEINSALRQQYEGIIKTSKDGYIIPADPIEALLNPCKPAGEMEVEMFSAELLALQNDLAIITIGRNAGEGEDRTNTEGDFQLSAIEKSLITVVSTAFHRQGKKVIVIMNIGGVIETASWRDMPDAILLAWQGGQETGNSIANILTGEVNPSGKLSSTFPMKYEDVPSAKNFPARLTNPLKPDTSQKAYNWMTPFRFPVPAEITYEEGIYIGYRYYATFGVKPAFEFGYGLSYTKFEYSNLKIVSSALKGYEIINVTIMNTGDKPGREVVQLYISAAKGQLDKPKFELKGFGKTKLLQPGESQTLTFELTARDVSSFDTGKSAWVAEAGEYAVLIGSSSTDIRLTASFNLKKQVVTEKVNPVLAPQVSICEPVPVS